jgi:hypothetical protein
MKQVTVRYKVKPDRVAENERLVRATLTSSIEPGQARFVHHSAAPHASIRPDDRCGKRIALILSVRRQARSGPGSPDGTPYHR